MLEGIKVLEFTMNVAGPTAAAELADYGADIIKVEKMTGAEERAFSPLIDGKSLTHCWLNRGKKSITMDMKDPRAIEIIKKLANQADVLVESLRPGVLAKLGLGYDDLKESNPGLIYCSISAFGQTGPYSKKPGYDVIAQALSGMMSITGEADGAPMRHGTTLADYFAGVAGYASIATALYHRSRTGEGQHIDMSLLNGMIHLNSMIDKLNEDIVVTRNGNHHPSIAPFGLFNGNNGESVVIAAPSGKAFGALCNAMNRQELIEDAKYKSVTGRANNQDELTKTIEDWLKTYDEIEQAIHVLEAQGVACSKVNTTKDVVNDPQVLHMKYLLDAPTSDDIKQETYMTRGPLAQFSKTPGEIRKAATLGQHTHEVLEGLGIAKEEIDAMLKDWTKE